jgi:hypothetical protein
MRDYGAMILALALVSVVAAITMDRLMVRTALAAYLLFAIPPRLPRDAPPALHAGPGDR